MANVFSNFYNGTPGSASVDASWRPEAGMLGRTRRVIAPTVDLPLANVADDVLMFASLHSSTRIWDIRVSNEVAINGTSLDVALGCYVSEPAHAGGTELDEDLFDASINLLSSNDHLAAFSTAVLEGYQRGRALWELLAFGLQTYTSDPDIMVDIGMKLLGTPAYTAGGEILLEMDITDAF